VINKNLVFSAFAVLFVLIAALFMFNRWSDKKTQEAIAKIEARLDAVEKIVMPPKEEPEVQKEAFVVPVGDSYVLGPKDAKVSITVFSNFQCPYCSRADKALRELLKDEELKSTTNIVFKHFPFDRHTNARPASKATLAAGEQGTDKFWAMAEKIFANQNDLSDKNYQKWAKEIGLDMAKFNAALKTNDKKYDDMINADIKLGADAAQLRGTPWILVGGWLLDGDIDVPTIKKMIKEKNL
jgi:protein-disulfide isomerase